MLVVLGGFGNQQMPIDIVEKFDPKTSEWTSLPVCQKRSIGFLIFLMAISLFCSVAVYECFVFLM